MKRLEYSSVCLPISYFFFSLLFFIIYFTDIFRSVNVTPGTGHIVDTGHVVAWPANMPYNVELAIPGSMISSFTSGEGFVIRFQGPGIVHVQNRSIPALKEWLGIQPSQNGQAGHVSNSISGVAGCCVVAMFLIFFGLIFIFAMVYGDGVNGGNANFNGGGRGQYYNRG